VPSKKKRAMVVPMVWSVPSARPSHNRALSAFLRIGGEQTHLPHPATQVVLGEEQVLRAGLAHYLDAVLTCVFQHIHFTGRIHMHDVYRCLGLGRQRTGPQGGFDRAPGRPGFGVPFGRQVVRRHGSEMSVSITSPFSACSITSMP